MNYRFFPKPKMLVWYRGKPLQNLVEQPTYRVNVNDPLMSQFEYNKSVVLLSDSIFDTVEILYSEREYCIAAMLSNHLYESFTRLDDEFKAAGQHVLSIPLWMSILKLVETWEIKHPETKLHIGTPLYFLSVAYFLTHNYDPGFIYLIQSIEGILNYPNTVQSFIILKKNLQI